MSVARSLLRIKAPRTVACIGRNYADHIKELGNTAPAEPFYFLKPASSILHPKAGPLLVPKNNNVHFEVELAAVIGPKGADDDVNPGNARERIKGYAVAIDMTSRTYQELAKKKGLPWTLSKGLKTFLPISHFIPKEKIPDPMNVELHLEVNGQVKQQDSTALMLKNVDQLITHCASVSPLEEDDLVLTGTPKGVGPVVPGDVITAGVRVNGQELEEGKIEVKVEERTSGYGSE
ncbi:hypothetical protein EX30DRAFT_333165 [Ascodesmis nigricans]|uniref:Fumarylacetoacetase-like C-terminal domain-containing protein n=1 Tax=Ascodesmis nigricans TaxID=341454 RepID=A0A4S2MT20_9PEZI|nr:hypothetical protein EX30DRAFT_333165 [Ascodesmis nigricans]